MSILTKVLGDPNEKELKKIRPIVEQVNGLEDEMQALSDEDLRSLTAEFRQELENGAALDDILPSAFAAVREASRRVTGLRHFDVQLIGGVVLHQGKIAEMRTGEGKTLVATLPSYLNALPGKGVHIVTVNDYLAQRDRNWMGKIHEFLGLDVGVILTTQQPQSAERRASYAADITYGTNNELGFDYLRDHMVGDLQFCSQRALNYAIVDEVDNILIDEARTPLIISGQAEESNELYKTFARLVPRLKHEDDYTIDEKTKTVAISDVGIDKVEQMLGIKNIYDDMELTRHLENALKAHALFQSEKEYIVRDGEVLIVDEFTGRVLSGRRYSEGLHQAIEAKEGVKIQNENRTLATITFQNYFRLYKKLAGMTGTALTEAEEFHKIYELDVVSIPTHRPIIRADHSDYIYRTEHGKFLAVVGEIKERHENGQPVLVGTTSVDVSESLADMLNRDGIPHNVLNAKQHAREATVIAQAGRPGAVTVATNMAGRGTDILLGGNPAGYVDDILREREIDPEFATEEDRAEALVEAERRCEGDRQRVIEAGGLYILGTERHESRRIDNQLRGRAGRQGDPGVSRFFLSLEDELMRRFGTDRAAGLMQKMGMDDDVPLEAAMVSKLIDQAQTKVEAYNFDIRKHVVEYDDVIAKQREVIYADRQAVLEKSDMHDRCMQMIESQVRMVAGAHMVAAHPDEWDLSGIVTQFDTWGVRVPDEFFPEDMNRLRREDVVNGLVELAQEAYAAKEASVAAAANEHSALESGEFYMRHFERMVLLQVVDSLWQEHIDHLDVMRSGIGLRGMAQRDPLNEFKSEGFKAFGELKEQIEHHVVDLLLRAPVQITIPEPEQQPLPRNLHTNAEAIAKLSGQAKGAGASLTKGALPAAADVLSSMGLVASNGAGNGNGGSGNGGSGNSHGNGGRQPAKSGSVAKGQMRAGASGGRQPARVPAASAASSASNPKIGRNDLCPCGSGKKYKVCHGR
ncbi:MAG: preprotein translocase subunit SecA [Ktedonobacterales bacterium]